MNVYWNKHLMATICSMLRTIVKISPKVSLSLLRCVLKCTCWSCLACYTRRFIFSGLRLMMWCVCQSVRQDDTACWACWDWQITSPVTPPMCYILSISLCHLGRLITSLSVDSDASTPLSRVNERALKGKLDQGSWFMRGRCSLGLGPLTLSLILDEGGCDVTQLWILRTPLLRLWGVKLHLFSSFCVV